MQEKPIEHGEALRVLSDGWRCDRLPAHMVLWLSHITVGLQATLESPPTPPPRSCSSPRSLTASFQPLGPRRETPRVSVRPPHRCVSQSSVILAVRPVSLETTGRDTIRDQPLFTILPRPAPITEHQHCNLHDCVPLSSTSHPISQIGRRPQHSSRTRPLFSIHLNPAKLSREDDLSLALDHPFLSTTLSEFCFIHNRSHQRCKASRETQRHRPVHHLLPTCAHRSCKARSVYDDALPFHYNQTRCGQIAHCSLQNVTPEHHFRSSLERAILTIRSSADQP
ncbi:hypothetical protein DPEC_G00123900 [Dallia pectoralis]|uniref:Uncharacterized protein n=1 Tax=Dallia pectoralis TaxID=75939 RepID=A0ACC2GQX3_DALPE|nr:hypothetical protein DPEC_G00123900 [Dallia pectoralis]